MPARNPAPLLFLSRLLAATIPRRAGLAAGCSSIERLKTVGEQADAFPQINNPTTKTGYRPVQMPMPAPQPASYNPKLRFWDANGSRALFQRPARATRSAISSPSR